jgi:membrane protease YdiL (CAAX protease family)
MSEQDIADALPSEVGGAGPGQPGTPAVNGRGRPGWPVVAELALVVLIHVGHYFHFVPLSKIPFLLGIGWISLRVRRVRWRDVGLKIDRRHWVATCLAGIAAGAALECFHLFVSTPALAALTGAQPDLSEYRILSHNLLLALIGLGFGWTFAALGEELVYRGYLMNRLADLGRGTRGAWIVSLLLTSALFGFGHAGQGMTGMLEEGLAGLLLGLLYLASGRNLAVPIIAHGVEDTIDVVLLYLGCFPGM